MQREYLDMYQTFLESPIGVLCIQADDDAVVALSVRLDQTEPREENANNKNPILILVPCHRVIGADGSLVGFGAGMAVKEYLLKLERFT